MDDVTWGSTLKLAAEVGDYYKQFFPDCIPAGVGILVVGGDIVSKVVKLRGERAILREKGDLDGIDDWLSGCQYNEHQAGD